MNDDEDSRMGKIMQIMACVLLSLLLMKFQRLLKRAGGLRGSTLFNDYEVALQQLLDDKEAVYFRFWLYKGRCRRYPSCCKRPTDDVSQLVLLSQYGYAGAAFGQEAGNKEF